MTLPPEWPRRIEGYGWLPCYWHDRVKLFGDLPDLIVIHSGSIADWVAEYMSNPVCGPRLAGSVRCPDRHWRRQVATHFAWYGGRISKLQGGTEPPSGGVGFVQQLDLQYQGWGAGGSVFRGDRQVNARAIHIELPGPVRGTERDDIQRVLLRILILAITRSLPRRESDPWKITGHQWIDPRKQDPGPAVDATWFSGLGCEVIWEDCRAT